MKDHKIKQQGAAVSKPRGDLEIAILDRLLRSAAQVREGAEPAMPFGFDTRVIALWRAARPTANGVCRSFGAWHWCRRL